MLDLLSQSSQHGDQSMALGTMRLCLIDALYI
jgi:hypothetical protein